MADQFDIDELVKQLRDLIPALNKLSGTAATGASAASRDSDRIVAAIAKLAAVMDKRTKDETRYIDRFTQSIDRAAEAQTKKAQADTEAAREAERAAKEKADLERRAGLTALERAQEDAKATSEASLEKRKATQNYARALADEQIRSSRSQSLFNTGIDKMAERVADRGGNVTDFYRRMQYTTEALSALGGGFKGFLGSVANGKTSFDSLTPIIDGIGKALSGIPFAGPALQALAEGAKFLLSQLQTATESFQKLGAVGALTTRGMSGVQEQFLQSGMSLEGFRNAVTANAATLARFGGTVGRGAEDFSKIVGQILDSEVGDQLRRLGYSADTFGDAAAGYVEQQTRLGVAQTRTNAQLAQGAAAYAKELDVLAKLTGMQREEIQKQQQAALSESRFRAKIDELTAQGRTAEAKALMDFQTMVSKASPELAQGLRDLATGNATTEAAQQVLRMGGQEILQQVESGLIGPVDAFKALQAGVRNNLPAMRDLAKAVGDETKAFTNYAQASDLANAKIVDGQVVLAEQNRQMARGTDRLTDNTVSAQKAMEQMSRQIQGLAFTILPNFSSVIEKTTSVMRDALQKLGVTLPTAAGGGAPGGGAGAGAGTAPPGGTGGGGAATTGGGGVFGAIGRGLSRLAAGGIGGAVNPEDVIRFTGNTGSKEHFDKLDPAVRDAFLMMARDYNNLTGDKLQINSAFRSPGEQAAIDPGANPKAAPGMSLHNVGRALDIQSNQKNYLAGAGLLERYGFKTLPNDPPHIFMQTGGVATGPRSGYSAMLHGTEAVVPLPDGKTIPVEMPNLDRNMQEQVNMMGAQLVALEELVRYMRENASISAKILQAANN